MSEHIWTHKYHIFIVNFTPRGRQSIKKSLYSAVYVYNSFRLSTTHNVPCSLCCRYQQIRNWKRLLFIFHHPHVCVCAQARVCINIVQKLHFLSRWHSPTWKNYCVYRETRVEKEKWKKLRDCAGRNDEWLLIVCSSEKNVKIGI